MASDFLETLKTAITNLVTLDIVTVVGEVDLSVDDVSGMKGAAIRTQINLVTGDNVTQFDPKFIGDGPYASLQAYHQTQADKGDQIIKANIEAIKALLELEAQYLSGGSTSPAASGASGTPSA